MSRKNKVSKTSPVKQPPKARKDSCSPAVVDKDVMESRELAEVVQLLSVLAVKGFKQSRRSAPSPQRHLQTLSLLHGAQVLVDRSLRCNKANSVNVNI